ncbi:MAG: putative DNA-binding transcriptional regulator YafY [Paraglaciecola sp.]|jgi:predicted DNA-binding transcriptional regulator YafY
MQARERIVRLLLRILTNPYQYSQKDLAKYFDFHSDQIKKDIQILKNIDIHIDYDKKYRYAIIPEKGFKELQILQHLTEAEQAKISRALNAQLGSSKEADYIANKLSGLYNFQKLGLRALRRPALDRIDQLEAAKKAKQQVILKNYKSNSGKTRDRYLEVFWVDAELDTIQAFDIDEKANHAEEDANRHFRLSRIQSVEILETSWQFSKEHRPKPTDVFRIANPNQARIHLKLKNQAYNFLAENYHKALSEIHPTSEPDIWHFETAVNADFYGLTNFIMAHYEHIEIVYPIDLQEHIRQKATALLNKLA